MRTRTLGWLALALVGCGAASAGSGPTTPTAEPSPSASSTSPAPGAPASPSASAAPASSATPPQAASATADANDEDLGSARERLMRRHFVEAAQVRAALIQGDLRNAGLIADKLGNMDDLAPIPRLWKPTIERVHFEAHRIQTSVDIPEAATALADLGATCGSCHKTNSGPNPGFGAPPPGTGSMTARMQRHAWAMERLWEGLYVPSDASWKAGADALKEEPFPKQVTDKGGVHTRSAASRFMAIVPNIAGQTTPEGRAKVYASLIATCSSCHVSSGATK